MTLDPPTVSTLELLQACPHGVLLLRGDRPVWINAALERLSGLDNARLEAPDAEADLPLRRLLGDERLIELRGPAAGETWLLCQSVEVTDDQGKPLRLRYYTDVSSEVQAKQERDLLARKVDELELTDALTGLGNRRALGNALTAQVTRSRRYHNPLSLGMVQIRLQGSGAPPPDGVVLAVSRYLRERLRWADVIGRWSQDSFMMILPETTREPAAALLESIRGEADTILLPEPSEGLDVTLLTGLAEWRKGMDPARLVAAAAEPLKIEAA